MHRTPRLLALALAMAAAPAAAQETIVVGQTVDGELSADDPKAAGGGLYDAWAFQAEPGVTYAITLQSADFDAYLWVGPRQGNSCDPCVDDDDAAGGTDARVVLHALTGGPHVIRATSYEAGESGRYTLTVEEAEGIPGAGVGLPEYHDPPVTVDTSTITRAGPALVPGIPGTGVLEEGDLRSEGAYFDVWLYTGTAGERVTISLRSDAFDTVLRLIHLVDGRWEELASDDDGGGGTDSELTFTLPGNNRYEVHAAAFYEGEEGAYTITLASGAGADSVVTAIPSGADLPIVVPGGTKDGALEAGDYVDEGGGFFDAYTYFASAGESASFELAASDFDGVLRIGTREDGEWREVERAEAGGSELAELTMRFPDRADYEIRIGSRLPGQTGTYTLYSTSSIHAELDSVVSPGSIVAGQTVRGRLEDTDERAENGAFVDVWNLSASGSEVTIDLRSREFDPLLRVLARQEDGGWREIASDDDGGVGTDSRLTLALPHPGRYRIHVTSYHEADAGEYRLSLRYGAP